MNQPNGIHSLELLKRAEQLGTQEHRWSEAADLLADCGDAQDVLGPRAFYLSRAKRYDEARAALQRLHALEPHSARPCYMLGYQYYAEERYKEAVPWFEEALARNPEHLNTWWRLAHARYRMGDHRKAQVAAGRVLRIWPTLPDDERQRHRRSFAKASYLLGRLQMSQDPAGAIPLLEQAVENDPDDHDKHYRLGKAFRIVGRKEEALSELRRADRMKPGQSYIVVELAAALAANGDAPTALHTLRRIAKCQAWNAVKAGRLALTLEDPALASQLLEQAMRDGTVRRDSNVQAELALARTQTPAPSARIAERSAIAPVGNLGERVDDVATGRVDVVRGKKGFGFLVDDRDGTRRYFRLRRDLRVRCGDRVRFIPQAAEKGPAARDLELV